MTRDLTAYDALVATLERPISARNWKEFYIQRRILSFLAAHCLFSLGVHRCVRTRPLKGQDVLRSVAGLRVHEADDTHIPVTLPHDAANTRSSLGSRTSLRARLRARGLGIVRIL